MATFMIGDKVTWLSGTLRRTGEVTFVVPADTKPKEIGARGVPAGPIRSSQSYVVRGHRADYQGRPVIRNFWPPASALEHIKPGRLVTDASPDWSPMDDAPRSGAPILAWCPVTTGRGGTQRIVRWSSDAGEECWRGEDHTTVSPTHWQPLPPDP